MFKKKTNQSSLGSVDTSRTVVPLCPRIAKYSEESLRPLELRYYEPLEEHKILPLLDDRLNKLFAGEIDSGNDDALNDTILSVVREALLDLDRQAQAYDQTLERILAKIHADREDTEKILHNHIEDYTKNQAILDKVIAMRQSCKEELL